MVIIFNFWIAGLEKGLGLVTGIAVYEPVELSAECAKARGNRVGAGELFA